MTRRTTGWVLLALAMLGAVVVAGLGWRQGSADPWLVALSAVGVGAGVLTVVVDRRVLARRAAGAGDGTGAPAAPRGRGTATG